MNKKVIAVICFAIAFILWSVGCAVVAYQFCDIQYGIIYRGYSAPVDIAFLWAIPFGAGAAIFLAAGLLCKKKAK